MTEVYPKIYVAYGKDLNSRLKSTSGAVCHILSKYVIGQGGAVSGIVFNEKYKAVRRIATSAEKIEAFRGSKYVQADQGRSYIDIKKYLDGGTLFLFTGTPCQVAGLKAFLGRGYDNLICVDFICLGTPSPTVWEAYLKEESGGREVSDITFKDKRNGWRDFTFHMGFSDGSGINVPGRDNPFMKNMIGKLYNRPSCHSCRYRMLDRPADITVADAWGMDKIVPELIDDRGTSSVVIRNKKGMELFCNIAEELTYKEVDVCDFMDAVPRAWVQPSEAQGRDTFFEVFRKKHSFFEALKGVEADL